MHTSTKFRIVFLFLLLLSSVIRAQGQPRIATYALPGNIFYAGQTLQVRFAASGFTNTTTFTAQLIYPSGSTYSPVNIGTANLLTTGSINCTIPANTPAGTGYRIRVVSSNPAETGTDNGTDITIHASPGYITQQILENFERPYQWPWGPWMGPGQSFPIDEEINVPGTISPAAAHTGNNGIINVEWGYRDDITLGKSGDKVSLWGKLDGEGAIHLGFGANYTGTFSLVMATNNSLSFQNNSGFQNNNIISSEFNWQSGKWYKLEVTWVNETNVEGTVYDSDGITALALLRSNFSFKPGGVAIKGLGGANIDDIAYQHASPQITSQPSFLTIAGGENASFRVAATGTNLNYQWQVSLDGGNTFNHISNGFVYSGATTSTLSITKAPISLDGYQYRALVSNSTGTGSLSNAATLIVKARFFDNTRTWQPVGTPGFSAGTTVQNNLALDGNGAPYAAFVVSGNPAVMKYNGIAWENVGNAINASPMPPDIGLALDGNNIPYLAYSETTNVNKATIIKYTDNSWVNVGNTGFSAGTANSPSLAIDKTSTPFVAYADGANNNNARVKKYNGSSWTDVGTAGISSGGTDYIRLAIDAMGTPFVAYIDNANGKKITVNKYTGTSWTNVGLTGFSAGAATYPSIAIDANGTPYVAYIDAANEDKVTVKRYNGSSWVSVGSAGVSVGGADWSSLALDWTGAPFVAYEDKVNQGKVTVKKYNGSNWVDVGLAGFSGGQAEFINLALDADGSPFVGYKDGANTNKATVMKFGAYVPLPVTWLSFAGQSKKDGNHLTWATALEENSEWFKVERSLNGKDFEEIGVVKAAGYSKNIQKYFFHDEKAINLPGSVMYYRLNQLDLDQNQAYSKVIAVSRLQNPVITVYPNPFDKIINISLATPIALTTGKVTLNAADGREIYNKTLANLGSPVITLDNLPPLAPGVYFLKIMVNNELSLHKLIKQ